MTDTAPYQGMSLAVVGELLGYIQAFDKNFVPDELDVRAYHVVAQDYRWTHHEALTAIRKWGGDHPEGQRMEPALLNRLIRSARNDQLSRQAGQPRTEIQGDARDGTGYPVGDDPDWGLNNSAELEQVHAEANVAECESCHQAVGERCKNTLTGNASKIPHPKRMKAAGMGGPSRKINRAMVLKHPDLVAELRKPPCSFTSPETWGGYLPPDRDQYGARNASPFRAQLDRIIAEARRREEAS
jgi:hypothetical protein